jgi:predicted nucleic acid-binding protein
LIILDANIVVSTLVGRHTRSVLKRALATGVKLAIPPPQLVEAYDVLTQKLGAAPGDAQEGLAQLARDVRRLEPSVYETHENLARERLHSRGQSDWPVLAAALALEAGIWSNDRDFFGVGVPVWSTQNIHFAASGDL